MTLLSLSRVGKRFATGTQALEGLSFQIAAGEFVSLLGPSGCGKSTALRLAAGLLEADAGEIAYPGGRPETAFVFQEPTLMPWADTLANARLPLDLKRIPRAEANDRARRALARAGLDGFERAYPRELSGGMKMRVSLARALCSFVEPARPKLLLLDEPFAALDELTRQRLDERLRKLWQTRRMTVIFVTHALAEAAFLAERALVMSRRPGRIVLDHALQLPSDRALDLRTQVEFVAETALLYRALSQHGALDDAADARGRESGRP